MFVISGWAVVSVTLVDAAGGEYQSSTSEDGVFYFASLPAGVYSLRAATPGFMSYEFSEVPNGRQHYQRGYRTPGRFRCRNGDSFGGGGDNPDGERVRFRH